MHIFVFCTRATIHQPISTNTHFNNPSPRGRQRMGCIDYWHCSYINMKLAKLAASDLCDIAPSRGSKWREQRLGFPCWSTINAITAEPSDLCVRVRFIWHSYTHQPHYFIKRWVSKAAGAQLMFLGRQIFFSFSSHIFSWFSPTASWTGLDLTHTHTQASKITVDVAINNALTRAWRLTGLWKLCLISKALVGGVTETCTYTCKNMPQAPLLCNWKPRVAVGTGKEWVGRKRERLDRARTSINAIRKLQVMMSGCPVLPAPSHRDTHLTGGSSWEVNTTLFLLPYTRKPNE